MSDVSQGPGWWVASDGKWYPPHLHPDYRPPDRTASPPPVLPSPPAHPLYRRPWVLISAAIVIIILVIAGSGGTKPNATKGASTRASAGEALSPTTAPTPNTTVSTTTPAPKVRTRVVRGKKVTLGAGSFTGGKDVAAGLYNVTAGPGQSGNFIVSGTDSYDEILGSLADGGVPEIRAQISNGDSIKIEGLSSVTFTPVTTPFVTTHSTVVLYAGTWTVGQDLGPGRYVATPGSGQSGNFIIDAEGVDEILGGSAAYGGVPSVTFNVSNGDVIDISGLSQVTLTPTN